MSAKACSKCGKTFHCRNEQKGCWCEGYTIHMEDLKNLYLEYDNCLCETCLSEYDQNKPKNVCK